VAQTEPDRRRFAGLGSNPLPEGTLAVGVGLIVTGLTAYGFLVVSARALGTEEYAPLSVLWALVFLGGPGFFLPLEQEVSRALSARRAQGLGGGPVLRRAAVFGGVLAAALVVACIALAPLLLDHLFDGQPLLLVGLAAGLVGYYAEHLARGSFSGLGRFGPYSSLLGAEGALRFLACLVLAFVGVETAGAYGLALGLAPLGAVAFSLRGQRDLVVAGPEAPWSELSTAIGWLLLGSVMAQGLLNAGPVTVQLLATEAQKEEVGRFLPGLIIARIPLFLFQAIQAALLPKLSALAGAGRLEEFKTGFRRLVLVVFAVGATATVVAFAIGPFAVRVLFGSEFDLPRRTLGLLAAGSAAYMLAVAMAQAVIALHGHRRMALTWVVSIATFLVVTALGDELFLRVEVGLLAASAVAAAGMAAAAMSRIRRGVDLVAGDVVEALHELPIEP
jgi:O-antigen/teichoic acid export membrane protein